MEEPIAKSPPTRPRWKRWGKVVAGVILTLSVVIYAVPRFLESEAARRWLLDQGRTRLGLGVVDINRFHFSWVGPTVLEGVMFRDSRGDLVLESPQVVWDRNLFQAIFLRPRLGTITLYRAMVDAERDGEGTIDLVECLKPLLRGPADSDLTVRVVDGGLSFRSPELVEPLRAQSFDLTVKKPPAPGKISWVANLHDGEERTLDFEGEFDRSADLPPNLKGLKLALSTNNWPIAIRRGDWTVSALFHKQFSATRQEGLWSVASDLEIRDFRATGPALREDALFFDRIIAQGEISQSSEGWAVGPFLLETPLGSLNATGPIPSTSSQPHRIEGRLDLAALAAKLPHALSLREGLRVDRGSAEIVVEAGEREGLRTWSAVATVADLAAHRGEAAYHLAQPATLTLDLVDAAEGPSVDRLAVRSAFLNAEGRGDSDRGIHVAGTLDLGALRDQAAEFVNLGEIAISGSGPISADFRREGGGFLAHLAMSFDEAGIGPAEDPVRLEGLRLSAATGGALTFDPSSWTTDASLVIKNARRAGLDLGPTEFLARIEPGKVALAPIATTLNGGRLTVVPELEMGDSPIFRLMPGTSLEDAEINEEASRRVLAFVAPVLDQATRVSGRVSARVDRAEIPIGPDAGTRAEVEGNVVFEDVTFAPGPVTADLLGLINRRDATLRLDQPVVLSIAEGRIRQSGLSVPVGDVTHIDVEGSVEFDKTLDLTASMAITDAMFPNGALIGEFVTGSRVKIPIGGTLDRPLVEKAAFQAAMKDLGKDVMIRGATQGVAELLFRLARPRDPNAPPPPTAAERKAMRQERRMQRKGGP